jgi:hypothetical protein
MPGNVAQLVTDLAADEDLMKSLLDAIRAGKGREWLDDHGYEFKPGVLAVLKELTWPEVKAMVKARNEMESNNVDNMVRLQMV